MDPEHIYSILFTVQNFTVHYWMEKGLRPKKLILGMPMYGRSFSLANKDNNGLQARSYGGGEAGKYTREGGFLAYYEVQNIPVYFILN